MYIFVANLKMYSNDISATFTKANAFAGFENSLSLDLSNDNSGETGSNLVMYCKIFTLGALPLDRFYP